MGAGAGAEPEATAAKAGFDAADRIMPAAGAVIASAPACLRNLRFCRFVVSFSSFIIVKTPDYGWFD